MKHAAGDRVVMFHLQERKGREGYEREYSHRPEEDGIECEREINVKKGRDKGKEGRAKKEIGVIGGKRKRQR